MEGDNDVAIKFKEDKEVFTLTFHGRSVLRRVRRILQRALRYSDSLQPRETVIVQEISPKLEELGQAWAIDQTTKVRQPKTSDAGKTAGSD